MESTDNIEERVSHRILPSLRDREWSATEISPIIPLLSEKGITTHGEILHYSDSTSDGYNITAPTMIGESRITFVRREPRDSEMYSYIQVVIENPDGTIAGKKLDLPPLQDPAIVLIDGQAILSGVFVVWGKDEKKHDVAQGWWTVFYTLDVDLTPKYLATGPEKMKDIRLVQRSNGKIGIFTRPTLEHQPSAIFGRVAYIEVSDITQITSENILKAKRIPLRSRLGEWLGTNQATEVDGKLWVVGHIARWEGVGKDRLRHYDAMAFVYDPEADQCSEMKIIATWADFMCPVAKREDLRFVVFAGGFVINTDMTITLYVGLNDCAAGKITIPNPFIPLVHEMEQSLLKQ